MGKLNALALMAFLLCSCSKEQVSEAPPVPTITNHEVGEWNNIHIGNKDLVGIRVQQFPDCQFEADRYEGKHPAMIIYVFKNNKAHQLVYEPNGAVSGDSWWDIPKGHWIWDTLDIRFVENK